MSPRRDLTLSKALGNKISALRKKMFPGHGGQSKCAKEFGVEVSSWNQWEKGTRIPSSEYQRKLAKFFDISVAELRGELPEGYATHPATPAEKEISKAKTLKSKLAQMKADRQAIIIYLSSSYQDHKVDHRKWLDTQCYLRGVIHEVNEDYLILYADQPITMEAIIPYSGIAFIKKFILPNTN